MQIFVKLLSGKTVTLDVLKTDTIALLKQKIQAQVGVQASEQRLLYSGNILENDHILADDDIPNEATIYAIYSPPILPGPITHGASVPKIQVRVQTSPTEHHILEVNPNDRVQVLVDKISERMGFVSDDTIQLYLGQQQLRPEQTMAAAGVFSECLIQVMITRKGC